jgi:hypothetical protein
MRWLVLLLVATTACFASKRYAVDRPGLECDRALRVARRTLDTLGYTITEMVAPKGERVPGVVSGTRTLPSGQVTHGSVRIVCSAGGAELQPIEDSIVPDYEFSRAFGYSFKSLVQRPDVETPMVQSGVQVLVEPLDKYEQRLDLGTEAVLSGNTLVRLTVRNGTDRAVALDASSVTLVSAQGSSSEPLGADAAAGVLAPGAGSDRVRRELLGRLEVPARSTATRFAIYSGGPFREARINVEDVETHESDGFVAPVQ